MHLVIDGYNLIRRSPELTRAEARGQGREALTAALKLYRQAKKHRVTVVLDGGANPLGERGSLNGVPLVYSGVDRTADDVIAALAAEHGDGVTVITDDQELAGRCEAHGAPVVGSGEFGDILLMAAWGMEGPLESDDEGWDFTTRKKGPSKREPKAKRKTSKRIKQL